MATAFAVTPYKVSICVLLQNYALPSQSAALPFPFSSVSQHNRLGLFLLALTKSHDDVLEPKLEQLLNQLREVCGPLAQWIIGHLTSRISALSCADDLFNFFAEARGLFAGSDSFPVEDNQVSLDPNSCLGIFLRRCILAFNVLSFEGVCHLLTMLSIYCKDALSSCLPYEFGVGGNLNNHLEALSGDESMEFENLVLRHVTKEAEIRKRPGERVPFHLHVPGALDAFIDDVQVHSVKRSKCVKRVAETCDHFNPPEDASRDANSYSELSFLRTNLQVQGYLMEQVGTLERNGGSLSVNAFELMLKRIKKLAPDLHRVNFLRHLNSLYHDDFFSALHDLHCYFDRSAGAEGLDFSPPSNGSSTPERFENSIKRNERFETSLLCLGMMHLHLGHPKQALEVFAEGVRFYQQQSNDSCLAYTLAVICNLLSETGVSSVTGILGSSYSPLINADTSFSVEQQLFILLTESLTRAENLKLQRLVALNHMAMAKFHLVHVQRPLLSFGPKASMNTKTCPINVCKELRLSSRLISEFSSECSTMTIDGAFSTAWLNNLTTTLGSVFLSQENGPESNPSHYQTLATPCSIPKSVLHIVGSSYLHRATAWETHGSAPLARMSCLTYATCFADASSSSDAALVHAKLIQYLAVTQGYKVAFSALKVAERKFLSSFRSVILLVKLQLLHEYALHRGNLKLAQRVCDELGLLASPASGVDMKLKTEAGLRHARTLLAAKQYGHAADVAHSLFCMCYKFNMQVENATVLLLLAEIHKKSGNAVMGLPYALACLSFCQSLNMDLLKASATITLAELLLSMGPKHATSSLVLVHEAFPMVLGHGGLELRARAHMAEAKCLLADPNFLVLEDPDAVLDPLRQASDEVQVLEWHEMAAEAFYLMAITFDQLGQLKQREEAADSFRKHLTALENPMDLNDPLYDTVITNLG